MKINPKTVDQKNLADVIGRHLLTKYGVKIIVCDKTYDGLFLQQ
ncbi:hypothetical protein [Bacillus sp. FJAT-27445]|nr:hypothetical protein [Bacillus sp. FJAT-27445]